MQLVMASVLSVLSVLLLGASAGLADVDDDNDRRGRRGFSDSILTTTGAGAAICATAGPRTTMMTKLDFGHFPGLRWRSG
jgi:hypothetical protein